MSSHPIKLLIEKADKAINEEDFDTLMDFYAEDAVLVIKPGMNAVGKEKIEKAFKRIADYFEHSLEVKQAGMQILETNDTALVLAKTIIFADNQPAIERKATYVFKRNNSNHWVCAIDNSYGHELLKENA